jgi:hypothetical protein
MRQHAVGAPANDAVKLPAGLEVESLPDGSLRLAQTQEARLHGWFAYLFAAVFWNLIIQVMLAGMLGFLPGHHQPQSALFTGAFLLFLVPFIAIGLVLAYVPVWSIMGHDEWVVSHHCMEKRWGWKSSQQRKSRLYADAQGQLELKYHAPDSDSSEYWSLELWCPNNQKNYRAQLQSTSSSKCSCEELRALGMLLSEKTGWPLLFRGRQSC